MDDQHKEMQAFYRVYAGLGPEDIPITVSTLL